MSRSWKPSESEMSNREAFGEVRRLRAVLARIVEMGSGPRAGNVPSAVLREVQNLAADALAVGRCEPATDAIELAMGMDAGG